MAWKNESRRHAMSAKGIKTAQKIKPVRNFDIQKYMGKWYEIKRLPAWFQKGCEDAIAEYSLKDDYVQVKNSCVKKGKRTFAYAKGYKVDNGRLEVDFVGGRIFTGDYNVLYVDKGYNTAIVGTKNRKNLWILARKKSIPAKTLLKLKSIAKSQGYDTTKLR